MAIRYNYVFLKNKNVSWKFGYTDLNRLIAFIFALKEIFGIGISRAKNIAALMGLGLSFRMIYFTFYLYDSMLKIFKENFFLDRRLKELITQYQEHFWELQTYHGIRLWTGLPSNGQRTRTNCQTQKRLMPSSVKLEASIKDFLFKHQQFVLGYVKKKKR